ncbi:MAG: zinc ribbon domain-containing protein [Bacteroidota bacterium]
MPTYVYRRADGSTFEHFQRITDDPLKEDPDTGTPVTRVISGGAGVQFKGSGFYETDYVRKSGASDSSEATSDSTPAATDSSSTAAEGSTSTDSTSASSSESDT